MEKPRQRSLSQNWDRIANMLTRTDKVLRPPPNPVPTNMLYKPPQDFCTGSSYIGSWNSMGMAGDGLYRLPHNVIYEGEMFDGMFHGQGTLHYPNGCKIEGIWERGSMVERQFVFADGNAYEDGNFTYCRKPDRRFATEKVSGVKPAGRSQLTNQDPPRSIPDGCYDTGEGFYNPVTKCLMHPKTGEIKRIPTHREEKWIKEHCRKAWDEVVGFKPEIYENWHEVEDSPSSSEDEKVEYLKSSLGDSSAAFTFSQIELMKNAVGADSAGNLTGVSSGLGASVVWIRPSSCQSMDRGIDDFQYKVNTDFGACRLSIIATDNERES